MNTLLQTVTASDARARFGELINSVYYNNATILVLKMGKPVVKIIKTDNNAVILNKDLAPFIGAWNDEEGDLIVKEMKKFRKGFKLF